MTYDLNESVNKLKKVIHTTQTTYSIAEILSLYRDNELILRPQYQRFFRWSPLQKAKLIESILLEIPMPIFFVYSTREGTFEVIDGQQRLSTIIEGFTSSCLHEITKMKNISQKNLETRHLNALNVLHFFGSFNTKDTPYEQRGFERPDIKFAHELLTHLMEKTS